MIKRVIFSYHIKLEMSQILGLPVVVLRLICLVEFQELFELHRQRLTRYGSQLGHILCGDPVGHHGHVLQKVYDEEHLV